MDYVIPLILLLIVLAVIKEITALRKLRREHDEILREFDDSDLPCHPELNLHTCDDHEACYEAWCKEEDIHRARLNQAHDLRVNHKGHNAADEPTYEDGPICGDRSGDF